MPNILRSDCLFSSILQPKSFTSAVESMPSLRRRPLLNSCHSQGHGCGGKPLDGSVQGLPRRWSLAIIAPVVPRTSPGINLALDHHTLTGARFARASLASREDNQPGAIEFQSANFFGCNDTVVLCRRHFTAAPSVERALRSGQSQAAAVHGILQLCFRN